MSRFDTYLFLTIALFALFLVNVYFMFSWKNKMIMAKNSIKSIDYKLQESVIKNQQLQIGKEIEQSSARIKKLTDKYLKMDFTKVDQVVSMNMNAA